MSISADATALIVWIVTVTPLALRLIAKGGL